MTADDLTFVDTDILVYAHDPSETHKQPLAQALLERLWASRTGTLSTQILQEFHVVATRKFDPPMRRRAAREIVALYGEPGGRRMVEAPLRPLAGGRDGLTDLLVASLSTTIRSRCHPGPAAGAGRPSGRLSRSTEAEGRVDRPEESARDRCEPLRFAESGFRRHRSPGAKRDRERDPRVAVVGVVFDEDQTTCRAKVALDEAEDGELVALEVERVRHDDPIERRQLERQREVGDERRDADVRERVTQRPHLNLKGAAVPIHRVDRAGRTEEVGERERERSFTRPEVCPDLPAPEDALPDQPDVDAMIHGDKSGARESRPRPARRATQYQADGTGAGRPASPEVLPCSEVASGGHHHWQMVVAQRTLFAAI